MLNVDRITSFLGQDLDAARFRPLAERLIVVMSIEGAESFGRSAGVRRERLGDPYPSTF